MESSLFSLSVALFLSPLIISQKVTLYLQPQNTIIWSWHTNCVRAPKLHHVSNLGLICMAIVCFPAFLIYTHRDHRSENQETQMASNLKPTKMWISSKPLGDTLQTCQDWHRKLKLVFFGFSCHGNVPWSQENPHGVSHALGSTIFSSSVTRRPYIDMTLQIKGGDKSPHLLLAGGDDDKRSEWSNLSAGAVKGVCCKNTC